MSEETAAPEIAFVAPVQAELSGRAKISARLLERLPSDSVATLDTSPSRRRVPGAVGSILRRRRECSALIRFCALAIRSHRIPISYVSVNADPGIVVTIAFVAIARLAGSSTIALHYHSERLACTRSAVRLLDTCGGQATVHLALCDGMARRMEAATPGIAPRIRVLGNGWLADEVTPVRQRSEPTLRLGFLGRFEADKGLDRALAVFTALADRRPASLEVAGIPRDENHGQNVRLEVTRAGANFTGPVFGPDKSAFLERVDVLLLPSTYRNETYPVSIVEALAHGCSIVAIDIGCVLDMVGDAGLVTSSDSFEERAVAFLAEFVPGTHSAQSAMNQAARLRQEGEAELRHLLQEWDVRAA